MKNLTEVKHIDVSVLWPSGETSARRWKGRRFKSSSNPLASVLSPEDLNFPGHNDFNN